MQVPADPTTYAPLWVRSSYSFLEGASEPEELVARAADLGLPAIAITDRDGVHGVVRAHLEAKKRGIHLVVGSDVSVCSEAAAQRASPDRPLAAADVRAGGAWGQGGADSEGSVLLLARDRGGYGRLCRLLTIGRQRCEKGASAVTWREIAEHAEGLTALWGGPGSLLVDEGRSPIPAAGLLREAFGGHVFALISDHLRAEDTPLRERTRQRARTLELPVVAANEVLYHTPARRRLHDVVSCIRHGVTLATAGQIIRANAEHALLPAAAFRPRFARIPGACLRSLEIAASCTFTMDDLRYVYPDEPDPDGRVETAQGRLARLTWQGAAERYADEAGGVRGGVPDDVRAQLERELGLIAELEYGGYFLTMWEIVQYCRRHGILCQGRGSAANSAVCYCLGVTAVDPVKMGLLFERFISRERAEPPDIDLDIAHERREEVIQWVYERYGRERAAMVANVIRYRPKSAVRDVGKVLGMPETALDRLAKLCGWRDPPGEETLRNAGLDPSHRAHQLLLELVAELQDFPRHLSIHPGGFLLGHEPVCELVPIENATMDDRTVIQWDKDDVEALGLFKVDLLALGALSLVDRCFALMREHEGVDLDMARLPHDDPTTYDLCCAADTVGVFQIESRAQMSMLPRLRPRRFYDLVIEVSIVRPGPITGGMVHPYLRRRRGEEPVEYPHPSLEPVLAKTLGVPLFQEQVMRLAVVAADYTPGEADQLRRDMAAWRKSGRIEGHRERLVARMTEKGIDEEFAVRVFDQIRGFGEYGFPESHAASFALISYATSYLKAWHPTAFTAALLNAQPMGFYSPATIVEDARRHGVVVRPVCAQRSLWDCTMEPLLGAGAGQGGRSTLDAGRSVLDPERPGHIVRPAHALRMGLRMVKGLRREGAEALLAARRDRPFDDLADLVRRTAGRAAGAGHGATAGLDEGGLVKLAEAGALDVFGLDRRQALWQVRALLEDRQLDLPLDRSDGPAPPFRALAPFEAIAWDYERTGHSVQGHPLSVLRPQLQRLGLPTAAQIRGMKDGQRLRYAGIVICRQRPGTANGTVFMTLEDETGFVNLVLWSRIFEEQGLVARGAVVLGVTGKLQNQQGVTHLVAEQLWVPELDDVPAGRSRDFH